MTANKKKILIIEDERDIREALQRLLLNEYNVYASPNGEEGLVLVAANPPDLIVLDLIMPGLDGVSVCESLKADLKTKHIPVIILTATNDEERRVKSFVAGADDVVSKPIRAKEFLARIKAKLEKVRESGAAQEIMRCGNLVLDNTKLEASINDKQITLTVLEFKLLRYLVTNKERILSREMCLEAMWEKDVTARVIDNHIVSLRKKLKGSEYTLVSIYGAGYSLKRSEKNE